MRISTKWLLWFVLVGIYVMALGGVFYYNLFKWTFDEKLKQEIIDTVKVYAPRINDNLLTKPRYVSMEEIEIFNEMVKNDERVVSLFLLNKMGSVRWHNKPALINKSWDDFKQISPPLTDAIAQAYSSKTAKIKQVKGQPFYEIAFPFTVRNDVIGLLDILVSRASAEVNIGSAMRKYVFGAVGVLFLLGLPLYFFLKHYVVNPIEHLADSVDAVQIKNLELRYPARSDEIGELAYSIAQLLGKVKADLNATIMSDSTSKDMEQNWWQALLNTVIPEGDSTITVDENNSVLHTTNCDLPHQENSAVRVHLLDVIDTKNQNNLLRLVAQSFESASGYVEGETEFKDRPCKVRVLHVGQSSDFQRTLIWFTPLENGSVSFNAGDVKV